jgi:hypothetical protein
MASTGGTADSTSRLVQVLDDAGVEFSTVKMALKEMGKDGTAPTIQELAKLSDQFNAIVDPADKAQFLLDKFGKSGTNMARAMELGGSAILAMNDGMSGGLILTEKNIQASEDYRKNMDELSDSWKGFKVAAGNAVIPALNNAISETKQYNQVMDEVIAKYGDAGERMNRYRTNLEMAKIATYEARDAANAHADALDGELTPALDTNTTSLEEQQKALQETSKANADIISGAISASKANEDYQKSQSDIAAQIDELTAKKEAMYPWEIDKINEAQGKIDELSQKYSDNAAAYVQAIETKVAMMAVEKIAMEDGVAGYSDAEFAKAQAILETTDVATAAAFSEQQAMTMVSDAVANGSISVQQFGSILDQVMADGVVSVDEVKAAINALPKEGTFLYKVQVEGMTNLGGLGAGFGGWEGKAAGGSVSAGVPYMVGEKGPEMMIPNSNGTIIPNNKLSSAAPSNNADVISAINASKLNMNELIRGLTTAMMRAGA